MYVFLDFSIAVKNLDLEFSSWTFCSDCVKDFIYHCDWKLFPFCLRVSMHNFDNLLFIKEIVSIFKTAAFLIYLQGLHMRLQEERKSHMKERFQGNLKPKRRDIYFSGLYKLCSVFMFCLSLTVLWVSYGLCWCNILSALFRVPLVSTKARK